MKHQKFDGTFNIIRRRLQRFPHREKNRKKCWKVKQAYQSFSKNPYEAGKNVLDPKCEFKLKCNQSLLDQHKSSTLSDHLFNIPLPDLEGLPPPPYILIDIAALQLL